MIHIDNENKGSKYCIAICFIVEILIIFVPLIIILNWEANAATHDCLK